MVSSNYFTVFTSGGINMSFCIAEVARDRKSVNSRESRVKLMSIRDVLHDR